MSGAEKQPGNTWVICEDEDGAVNVTVILGFGEFLDTLGGDGVSTGHLASLPPEY